MITKVLITLDGAAVGHLAVAPPSGQGVEIGTISLLYVSPQVGLQSVALALPLCFLPLYPRGHGARLRRMATGMPSLPQFGGFNGSVSAQRKGPE